MRIAICGSAPSSARLAPYIDKSIKEATAALPVQPPNPYQDQVWEIWGCSPALYGIANRHTRWFELHRWEPGQPWFSPEYCQWLRSFRGPIYTGGPVPELPTAVPYPLRAVENEFGPYFLTSSISLMQALAIMEIEAARKAGLIAPDEGTIGLFGVDMAATEEWNEQRPGCQFFVIEALRRGITMYVPPESDLLRPIPVYGLCEWDHRYIKGMQRARELSSRQKDAMQRREAAHIEAAQLSGALDDHNWQIKTWASPYGLPSGVYLRHSPGTGLGGGTSVNERPITEPARAEEVPLPGGGTALRSEPGVVSLVAGGKPYTGNVRLTGGSTSGPKRKRRSRPKR